MINLLEPIASIVGKLLDKLLLNDEARFLRDKKELGKYLIRTAGIIDAYLQECTRLTADLQTCDQLPDDGLLQSVTSRFERIGYLTFEFASTIGEITYLRLFDAKAEESLVAGALGEFGVLWPGTYASLCFDADEAAKKLALSLPGIQTLAENAQRDLAIVVSINDEPSRQSLLSQVQQTMETLRTAYERLSSFITKHYAVWELFGGRKEYNRANDS